MNYFQILQLASRIASEVQRYKRQGLRGEAAFYAGARGLAETLETRNPELPYAAGYDRPIQPVFGAEFPDIFTD